MDLAFNKKGRDDRKRWLEAYDRSRCCASLAAVSDVLTY
jgi:hypothetical protein